MSCTRYIIKRLADACKNKNNRVLGTLINNERMSIK